MSSSPIPKRREPQNSLATPAKGLLKLPKPQAFAEQFRSPDSTSGDNWDDDFASVISPNALQLPHLRPHDNFGGLLSSEKLKAYASFETVAEEANWDDNFEGDLTVKSPMQLVESDPLQTVRPYPPKINAPKEGKHSTPKKLQNGSVAESSRTKAMVPKPIQSRQHLSKATAGSRPTMLYREKSIEEYSGLIVANDDALGSKVLTGKVSIQEHLVTSNDTEDRLDRVYASVGHLWLTKSG